MTYNEVLTAARGQMGPCKACPVCDGRACRNTVPGPGAKGVGDVAIRNYSAWQNVRVNMDTICESGEPDTTLEMFGHSYRIPVFAGPVGAMQLHYGTKYTDLEYNDILVPACHDAGILAFTGDGTNPAVMVGACKAVKANAGFGIPTVKPWDAGTMCPPQQKFCRKLRRPSMAAARFWWMAASARVWMYLRRWPLAQTPY